MHGYTDAYPYNILICNTVSLTICALNTLLPTNSFSLAYHLLHYCFLYIWRVKSKCSKCFQTRDVCKTLCPLKVFFLSQMFCTTGLVSSTSGEGRSRRSRVIDWKRFRPIWPDLTLVTLTIDQVTQKGFLCQPEWKYGPSLRKIGQGVHELLIRNKKVTDI